MAVNQSVVKAMTSTYSRASLEAALAKALDDLLAGVQITSVTFEGGGASGTPVSREPAYIVELCQAALAQMDDADLASRPSAAFVDLSQRTFGT